MSGICHEGGVTLAKKRKDWKQKGHYQRRFEDEDFAWLAEQFEKQAARNPDLTLEEFAICHSVEPKWIRSFTNVGWNIEFKNVITVWHGTTIDRAKAIMTEGFKAQGRKSGLPKNQAKPTGGQLG
jgi:hypothetical protein